MDNNVSLKEKERENDSAKYILNLIEQNALVPNLSSEVLTISAKKIIFSFSNFLLLVILSETEHEDFFVTQHY